MTDTAQIPKATSHPYGERSQQNMLSKYRNRHANHWKERIRCAHDLFDAHVRPQLAERPKEQVLIVDVGCSIGTFALEFSRSGYRAVGVDFDPAAIAIARQLAEEEGLSATFRCLDVADWKSTDLPPIDVAVCFDIFEHLHDDEIGALLLALRQSLAPGGRMIFSTTPTQFSYLWSGGGLRTRVTTFLAFSMRWTSKRFFERWIKSLAALTDVLLIWRRGATHKELVRRDKHCNLLTLDRVRDILLRNGWQPEMIETCNLHRERFRHLEKVYRHPITHTHIIGVASPAHRR